MKRIRLPSEIVYLLSLTIMSLSVAMTAAADFGVSMVVAPAYILSLKWSFLTFGQAEYIVQGVLFVVFCLLMKRVKPLYFTSFATGVLYGLILDFWRVAIPAFNPDIVAPGSMAMPLRIFYFVFGMVMTSLAVALLFRVYLYPQVYDFFVKGIAKHFRLNRTRFKQGFDATLLLLSAALSLLLFGTFRGIGIGTIVMTVCNGALIGLFGNRIDRFLDIRPQFEKIAAAFKMD